MECLLRVAEYKPKDIKELVLILILMECLLRRIMENKTFKPELS